MILSFYYLKIAVSLDISALYHSKIQALFYILFNAGVSNFDINKSHPQWGLWQLNSAGGASFLFTYPIALIKNILFICPVPENSAEEQIGYLRPTLTSTIIQKGISDGTWRSGRVFIIGQ